MSYYDKFKEQARDAIKNATAEVTKDFAKKAALNAVSGFPIAVSQEQLNALVANSIADDARISSLLFTCQNDAITIECEAKLVGVPLIYSTKLAIETCEISPTRKVLELRRLDQGELGGSGFAGALFARTVKILVCGLFGIDPVKFGLQGYAGIVVEGNYITADLEAMGATEAILGAVKAKLPKYAVPWLDAAGGLLFARLGIDEIAIGEGSITGKVVIHPSVTRLPTINLS